MNIIEEIKAANQIYLQEQWDKWLIDGWKNYKDQFMQASCDIFCYKNKISKDNFMLLKRTPKLPYHFRCRINRYFAAYLHDVSEALWNGWSDSSVLQMMKNLDTDLKQSDEKKYRKERNEHKRSCKSAMAEQVAHDLVKLQRETNSRSNWKACK